MKSSPRFHQKSTQHYSSQGNIRYIKARCIYAFVSGVELKAVFQCAVGRLLDGGLCFTYAVMLLRGITHMRFIAAKHKLTISLLTPTVVRTG